MRVIKMLFLTVFVLVVLLIAGVVLFVITFDANRFKPQIVAQASKALGRTVDLSNIRLDLSVTGGIFLKITGLSVSENPSFGSGDFLTIGHLSAGLDPVAFLTKKEISLSTIEIQSPSLTIIRDKEGRVNVATVGQESQTGGSSAAGAPQKAAVPFLLVNALRVKDMTVTYIDKTFTPEMSIPVERVDFSLDQFSLNRPSGFDIKAQVFSSQQNVTGTGQLEVDLVQQKGVVSGLVFSTDLSQWDMQRLRTALPMIKDAVLPSDLKGTVKLTVDKIEAGAAGLSSWKGLVELSAGSLRIEPLAKAVEQLQVKTVVTQKDIQIESVSMMLGQGILKGDGVVRDYLKEQSFSADVTFDNMRVEELVAPSSLPVKVEGGVSGAMSLSGAGFEPQAVLKTLSGEGKLTVKGGRLVDVNILREVFDKLTLVPGLAQKLEANVPEDVKEKLKRTDTPLSDVSASLKIKDGAVLLQPFNVGTDVLTFSGESQIGFNADLAVKGGIVIPASLTQIMITAVEELQYLQNEKKEISVPVSFEKKGTAFKFSVPVGDIAGQVLMNKGTEQLRKWMDKGQESGQGETQPVRQPAQESAVSTQNQAATSIPPEEKSAEQQIVEGVLGAIFSSQEKSE